MIRSRRGFVPATILVAVVASMSPATGATAGSGTWSVTKLPQPRGGGEPSLASDRVGDVYVSEPLAIPAAAGNQNGVRFWISRDNGRTFATPLNLGAQTGGGDSDVAVPAGDDQTVYMADLEAWASAVCVSRDRGNTWTGAGPAPDTNNCTTVTPGNYGPSNDREWLVGDRGGRVYLTYHEFVSAQPLTFRSDNYGADGFTGGPCGSMVSDPTIEANMLNDVTEGTLVAKPVLDAKGNLYVLVFSSTQQQQAAALQAGQMAPTLSQAYMMVSNDGCQTWTDYTIFDGSAVGTNSVNLANPFGALAIDGSGTLYAVGSGYIGTQSFPSNHANNLLLFTSRDHGATWSKPLQVDSGDTTKLPAAVGGAKPGQLVIGYFRTINGVTDPGSSTAKWVYTMAETAAGDSATPVFNFSDMSGGAIYNTGVWTRSPIYDFTSATLGAANCPLFVWAGNTGGKADTYVARETTGCFAGATAAATVTTSSPSPVPIPAASATAGPGGSPLPNTTPSLPTPLSAIVLGALSMLLLGAVLVRSRLGRI